jgi:hypothetical protein
MTNRLLTLLAIVFLFSCEQRQENRKLIVSVETREEQSTLTQLPKEEPGDNGKSWLTPEFLSADFNGDGYYDTAYAIIINNKKGMQIRHGNTSDEFLIGAGNNFGGDDFNWVKKWNLVTDKTTHEITFKEDGDIDGSREVKLDNTAFYIGADDAGGATIAWKGGRYIWIHQAH